MYKSPIEIIQGQIRMEQENNIMKAVIEQGIIVDKAELLRALQYDRDQYRKGYEDGRAEVVHCINCQKHEPCEVRNRVWCRQMGRYMKEDGFCSEGVNEDA